MARILLVDDDQSLLMMMDLMMKRSGHTLLVASGAREGLEIARKKQPDAAIIDVMMPEMNGYQMCRTLKEDPDTKHIPLLILTALSSSDEHEIATDYGADDFLTKPVTVDLLIEHVTSLLATGPRNMPQPLS